MRSFVVAGLALGSLGLIAGWLVWSRRHPRPCPWWLRCLLENPYMAHLAGPDLLIRRIDLRPGMSVLDLGCGPGRLTLALARHVGPKGRVTACDVQEQMLRLVRERVDADHLRNVELVQGRAGEGELTWESAFDRAILVTVLGEIRNKCAALREIYRALKPGGLVSITEVLPDPDFQSRSAVESLCKHTGFELQSHHGSMAAFTLNFRKPAFPT